MTTEELVALIRDPEAEHLECKAAVSRYDFEECARYVCAIANEGGGVMVLGVTDARPRMVVGSAAFEEPGRTGAGLFDRLGLRAAVTEHLVEGKRLVVIEIPSRMPGRAVSCRGAYWMRVGDSLLPMTDERLRAIHREVEPDFSAEVCSGLALDDLAPEAISDFRGRWIDKSGSHRLAQLDEADLLKAAELTDSAGYLNYAALLMLGKPSAVARLLPNAEVIYEYRSGEAAGPAQDRREFKQGFLLITQQLWDLVNARNDRQSIQEGFFRREIPTFDEKVIREAILNAVTHRDYREQPSIFVRQYPRRIEVVSPGGFPGRVTSDNIRSQQHPRNRRLAEAFNKIGLVERAGQGVDLMFEQSLKQGKPLPSYSGTSAHEVRLTLDGLVTSPKLVAVLDRIGAEQLRAFTVEDLMVLDLLQRGTAVPSLLRSRLGPLQELGLVESIGRGRSVRYLLSRRVSTEIGQSAIYTRRRGLDRETNKELLLRHMLGSGHDGSSLSDLEGVLPALSRSHVQGLLRELREENRVAMRGKRRWARWIHSETLL